MSQEENSSPQKKKKGKKSMSSIRLEGVVKKFTDKEVSLFKKKGREIKTIFPEDAIDEKIRFTANTLGVDWPLLNERLDF